MLRRKARKVKCCRHQSLKLTIWDWGMRKVFRQQQNWLGFRERWNGAEGHPGRARGVLGDSTPGILQKASVNMAGYSIPRDSQPPLLPQGQLGPVSASTGSPKSTSQNRLSKFFLWVTAPQALAVPILTGTPPYPYQGVLTRNTRKCTNLAGI